MTDSPALEVLLPRVLTGTTLAPDDDAGLLAVFDDPPPNPTTGAHVRAVMLASLDGAATGADGRSGSLGDAADRRVFGTLRALADVVLVGAGTVRAEGYADVQVPERLRAVRAARGRADRVQLAVVTGSGDLPEAVLDAGAFVVTASGAPGLPALRDRIGAERVIVADCAAFGWGADARAGRVDLAAGLRALVGRGLTRVHAEGGPGLLARLAAAGVLDEVCLTIAPALVGGPAPRILDGASWLDPATRLELVHLLRGGDTLLGRWRVA